MYTKTLEQSSMDHWSIVDWLSFTVPGDATVPIMTMGQEIAHALAVVRDYPGLWAFLPSADWGSKPTDATTDALQGLELAKARFPYKNSLKTSDGGLRLFFDRMHDHVLVEVSGQGCEHLRHKDSLLACMRSAVDNLTRIDLAVDVKTDMSPLEAFDCLPDNRWRSNGHQQSDTGTTVYIGSQRSDRFARVYRYSPPHPRSNFLRFEMVFRRKNAINVGHETLRQGVEATSRSAGAVFDFQHCPVFPQDDATPLSAWRAERTRAKSERWFYAQVVPAIRRMLDDGTLTKFEVAAAILGSDE
jgi:hypothetical protein